jgi:hypothetical protein
MNPSNKSLKLSRTSRWKKKLKKIKLSLSQEAKGLETGIKRAKNQATMVNLQVNSHRRG